MASVGIGTAALDSRSIESIVDNAKNGALCTFVGVVRNHSRGKQVAYLQYDAHVTLAEKELLRIAQQAELRWSVDVAIYHRLGKLMIGEASVVISVGSPHRAEAFEACKWCIDTLKQTVPIWKRETCPDGTYWIEGENAVEAEGP